jgi:signal recognition particle receptor subunit beta
VPVLLACNKQDMGSKAHTLEFIRKRLERELDQVRGWTVLAGRWWGACVLFG